LASPGVGAGTTPVVPEAAVAAVAAALLPDAVVAPFVEPLVGVAAAPDFVPPPVPSKKRASSVGAAVPSGTPVAAVDAVVAVDALDAAGAPMLLVSGDGAVEAGPAATVEDASAAAAGSADAVVGTGLSPEVVGCVPAVIVGVPVAEAAAWGSVAVAEAAACGATAGAGAASAGAGAGAAAVVLLAAFSGALSGSEAVGGVTVVRGGCWSQACRPSAAAAASRVKCQRFTIAPPP
jgi:hypothetical protein